MEQETEWLLRRVSLRQLKVFETVVRHGSFTRAAEELFLTQPTVSMQIKKLVDAMQLPLFEQTGKHMRLTEAGQKLHDTCREVFNRLAEYEMAVADLKGMKRGRLRLAVISTAEYFAPRLLGPFCQRYPGIDVSLEVNNREQVLQSLAENRDDIYILGQPPEGLEVQASAFLENPLVVVAPRNHILATRKNLSLAELAQQPFIMREPGSGTRMATQALFDAQNIRIQVRMELGSNEAIKQAIVGGLGISVLSQHTLTQEAATGQLIILDVAGFPIRRYWYACYPKGKQLSVLARTFYEYLQNECKSE